MRLFKVGPAPQEIQGVQVSTAVNSLPTPIVYGTPRFAGNVIWLNGFVASPAPSASGKGAGKDIASYVYNAYFIMGLCEGPICAPQLSNSFAGKPTANQIVYTYTTILGLFSLPVALLGSTITAGIAATSSTTFLIKQNGTTVGSFNFAAGATQATFTLAAFVPYLFGDILTLVAPASPDATLANLSWLIQGFTEPWVKYIDGTAYTFPFAYFTKTQTISELEFADGDYAQVANPTIVSGWPTEALAYRGISYVFGPNYRIDTSATVPQLQFTAAGFLTGTCPLNKSTIVLFTQTPPYANEQVPIGYADADPALCVEDILTNAIYGAGFPANLIDPGLFSTSLAFTTGDSAYQTYCQAVGFGFSVALDSTESCSSILQRWMDLTNTAPVWTGTTLKFIPYGDQAYSSNPGWGSDNPLNIGQKFYIPNITPLFALDDDDFEQSSQPTEDPLTEDRKDISAKYNTVRLSFKDRTNAWNSNVSEAKDENSIELYGIRVDNLAEAKEFTLASYCAISAQLRVQRNVAIDRTYAFKLSWAYCILEPMDVVTITDVTIGIVGQLIRIVTIEEDERGVLTIEAEILSIGSATAVLYAKQQSAASTSFYTGASPSPIHQPFIFEPTAKMLAAQSQPSPTIAIGACGGLSDTFDTNWGGAQVFIGIGAAPSAFSSFGIINGPSRMGVLASSASSNGNIYLDLNQSGGTLETVTPTDAANNVSLCAMTKSNYSALELFSYETSTLTALGQYTLSSVGMSRGLYGTTAQAWSAADLFLRIDSDTFELVLPPQYIGQQLTTKLISFNTVGLITDTLANATPYTYTPNGSGTNPTTNPIINALAGGTNQDWGIVGTVVVGSADFSPVNIPTALTIDLGTVV